MGAIAAWYWQRKRVRARDMRAAIDFKRGDRRLSVRTAFKRHSPSRFIFYFTVALSSCHHFRPYRAQGERGIGKRTPGGSHMVPECECDRPHDLEFTSGVQDVVDRPCTCRDDAGKRYG